MDDSGTNAMRKLLLRTPLGVKCVDSATQKVTPDGVRLTLRPLFEKNVGKAMLPFAAASGIMGFQNLGLYVPLRQEKPSVPLRDWERDEDVRKIIHREFLLCGTARDTRFLEFCQVVKSELLTGDATPDARSERLIQWNCYSSPHRPPIANMTAIRGKLIFDAGVKRVPAVFARIDIKYTGHADVAATGFSDADGAFAVFLPLPSVQWKAESHVKGELSQRRFAATLTVQFEPSKQKVYCVSPQGKLIVLDGNSRAESAMYRAAGWQCLPDWNSVQDAQSAAKIAAGAENVTEQTLRIAWRAENPIDGDITLVEIA